MSLKASAGRFTYEIKHHGAKSVSLTVADIRDRYVEWRGPTVVVLREEAIVALFGEAALVHIKERLSHDE